MEVAPASLGPRVRIHRLIGVYDADGTLRGELAYFVGVRLGRTHCSLCAITHGLVRERSDWRKCRGALPVAFDPYHRNDQPRAVAELLGPDLPAVVAETDRGFVRLLGPRDLDACEASPESMEPALADAACREGLEWGGALD